MHIREETPADIDAIHRLTVVAFAPMPFSDQTEADAIKALRRDGDLTISLVMAEDGTILGHVAFSPVTIGGVHNGWFGLGPVSVTPARQKQGIGKALISRGLDILRERGANGCALIGNPDIYSRMGFRCDGRLHYRDLDTKFVQRIAFHGDAPSGILVFAPGLEAERPL
jgi:putative acetyltransferase